DCRRLPSARSVAIELLRAISRPGTQDIESAVSIYRFKFIDCLAGAVPNNRHDLDLLSDDDCRGAGQLVMTRRSQLRPDKSRPVVSSDAAGRGALMIRFLRRVALQTEEKNPVVLSYVRGSFQRIKQRLRHL